MSPTFAAGPRKLLSWNTGLPAINLLALAARSGLSINWKADVAAFTSKAKNDAAPRFSVGPSIYRGCSCTCHAHPSETESIAVRARLDAVDWKILKELQTDGRMTNVELAKRVGISAPPCLRRVRSLEEEGVIKGYRTLMDEGALGFELTVFAMVNLVSQAGPDLAAFETYVRGQPLVRECFMLSGDIDFVLKCVAPDLRAFQAFVSELTAAPAVRNVKTALTLRAIKEERMVPLDLSATN
jgi:DNA-binding Lrp family transcriptional regulator